jgi:hypothetical protein
VDSGCASVKAHHFPSNMWKADERCGSCRDFARSNRLCQNIDLTASLRISLVM